MTALQEVDLPVDYIVLDTGYTARIADKKAHLANLLEEHGISATPLFIFDNVHADGIINLEAHPDELVTLQALLNKARCRGYIVFQHRKFSDALPLKSVLEDLQYCVMYNLSSIKYLVAKKEDRDVHFVIVKVDSESG